MAISGKVSFTEVSKLQRAAKLCQISGHTISGVMTIYDHTDLGR